MALLIIFVCLFRKFNNLSKDYQAEQKENSSSKTVLIAKIVVIFICILYSVNTFLFNIVSPALLYLDLQEIAHDRQETYRMFMLHLDWIMSIADFLACMMILYLIH